MAQSLFKRIFFSIYSYTIIYALFGVLSLSYHACFNSSLSTLEKRYHFSSSTGGLIMITDNIATVLTNLFIGYYGKTAHKPRWMSIGCVVTGLSVMITALPYFIYGPAEESDLEFVRNVTLSKTSKSGDQICLSQSIKEDCSIMSANDKYMMTMVAVGCFAISNFFRGFGTSIYFTYGTPYLDDNVSKARMPTFFAFIFAARIFGAPIGFFLNSLSLKYYENPFAVPPNLTNSDPRWIGAWWIGFLVSGSLMLLLAIPLSCFPREFKNSTREEREAEAAKRKILGNNVVESHSLNERVYFTQQSQPQPSPNSDSIISTIQPPQYNDVITPSSSNGCNNNNNNSNNNHQQQNNKTTMTTNLDDVDGCEDYATARTTTASQGKESNKKKQDLSLKELPGEVFQILTNPIIICQMMGNLFRGIGIIGYFVFQTKYLEAQFRASASKASLVSGTTGFFAKIMGVLSGGLLITILRPGPRVLTTFIFFVELTSIFTLLYGASVRGPQYNYPHTMIKPNDQLDLTNECNNNCHCENLRYQPVCELKEMKAYFSPCHAGCKNSFKTADGGSTFTECNCIENQSKTLEKCPPDLDSLMKYAYIIALGGMISGSSRSGNMVTFFRSINPDQKSLAVAVGSFWHSLFVSIPYPIIYGKIFDFCCLVWSRECNKQGNCWLYDTEKLRYVYHGISIGLIALGSIFDLIMIFLSPRLGNLYDEDDEDGNKDGNKKTLLDRIMFWRHRDSMRIPQDDIEKTIDYRAPKSKLKSKN